MANYHSILDPAKQKHELLLERPPQSQRYSFGNQPVDRAVGGLAGFRGLVSLPLSGYFGRTRVVPACGDGGRDSGAVDHLGGF